MNSTICSKQKQQENLHLSPKHITKGKTLRDFKKRYNKAKLHIENCSCNIVMTALMIGIQHIDTKKSISRKKPTLLAELLDRVKK